MDRRRFLQTLAAAGAARWLSPGNIQAEDKLGKTLPLRKLGARGPEVTCLGLGGYHICSGTEARAQATIETALEEGIRFFDTAESYGPHISEERYGKFLTPRHRDSIFLMTKSMARDGATARQHLEDSLRRLHCDVIDLWQIHSLHSPAEVDGLLAAGMLETALQAQKEGKIRHIGFTGHTDPQAHLRMLEKTAAATSPFLACQFPINPVDAAARHSFIAQFLPKAQEQGLGLLAMKTLANGKFFGSDSVIPGTLSVADCVSFVLSLPVSVLITGAETPELVREKAGMARSFHRLSDTERANLVRRVAGFAAAGDVETYKSRTLRG